MSTIVRAVVFALAVVLPIYAVTLPSQGYIVYTLSDGAIYRRMLNESQGVKIVNQGRDPNINPKNGGIIVYIENAGASRQAVLTDPDGLTHRVVGGTYSGMNGVYWTDRGDRFSFAYGNRQWGLMDTLGNFKEIPVPVQGADPYHSPGVSKCSPDSKWNYYTMGSNDGGVNRPIIRGNLIFYDANAHQQYGHIDQDHPENGIPRSSQLGADGCYGTLAPGGDAVANHEGGHGSVIVNNISNNPDGSICRGDKWSFNVMTSSEGGSYGIKWSNDFQWLIVRTTGGWSAGGAGSYKIVHLPPYGSTTLPDNPAYMSFQSFPEGFYALPDMWVGSFSRVNMAAAPVISSTATSVQDSFAVTMTSADAQAAVRYTLDGSDPTNQSTLYAQPFGIRLTADSLVIKARAYKTGVDPSSISRYVVRRFKLRDPDNVDAVFGLSYSYYTTTGALSELPDFSTLTPAATGIVDSFSLSPATAATNFAILYEGYVSVPADGVYRFATSSDDGSKLWIGDSLVVNNDNPHAIQERTGTIGLKAGLHKIAVGYFQGGGGLGLTVSYACTTLAQTLKPIGKSNCFHVDRIRISSPAAGSVFHLGDTIHLRWSYIAGSHVRIQYSANNGKSYPFEWEPVAGDAQGAGSFDAVLAITDTAMVSTQAKFQLVAYSDPSVSATSGIFSVLRPGATSRQPTSHRFHANAAFIGNRSVVWRGVAGEALPRVSIVALDGRSHELRPVRTASLARWDAGSLPAGVYVIKIRTPKTEITRRIAIER